MKHDTETDTVVAELYEAEKERMEAHSANEGSSDLQSESLAPYNDGLPYDRDRIMTEIRFFMNQTVEGTIETGKRFIVLKEQEVRNFYKCLDDLGVSPATAWRFMTIARKLANLSRVKDFKVLDLKKGIGKLYALLDIPDDELKEFEETGELRGLTLDEIDALPVKALKERLRKRNAQVEQGTLQLKEAQAKIDALEEEIRDLKSPRRTEAEELFVKKMEALKLGFDGYLLKLDPDRVRELDPDADPAPTKRMEAAYISALQYMRMQILTVWDRGIMMYGDAISMPEESGPAAQ